MARQKRKSPVIEAAKVRAASLASISPTLDLGSDMTLEAYNSAIADGETKLKEYNTKLSELDDFLNVVMDHEANIADWSERMLSGVATKFGKASSEYEKAGGTRKSERKKPVRAKKTEQKPAE